MNEPLNASPERPYLIASAIGNLLIASIGLVVSALSSSQAIMLDGVFNLTYFATGLFTLKVARLISRGDDERFPYSYAFFEPLVNGLKGVLVLGISIMALVGAVQALFGGGREIAAGLAIGYGIFASIVCGAAALATRRGARRTASPLVRADAENWTVNGAISMCVLLAFGAIFLIRGTSLEWLVPYVDPIVVLAVVLISISVPVRMAWQALMELLNRAASKEIVDQVTEIVDASTAELPVGQRFVRVVQPGRTRLVSVHFVLPDDFGPVGLNAFDEVRQRTLDRLQAVHPETVLDVVFTSDPQWGAPISQSGQGPAPREPRKGPQAEGT
jgi:cation diffusion facilitator family transporter